jgi:hypothetical protein
VNAAFLSGSINSGKSTVGALLSRMVSNGLYLDGDDFAPSSEPFERRIVVALRRLIEATIKNATEGKFVIAAYPLSDRDWSAVTQAMGEHGLAAACVTLSPPLDVALVDRGTRRLTDFERTRIREMYREGYARPSFGLIVNNAGETPEATARRIHHALGLPAL